jgi:hypothetical protein
MGVFPITYWFAVCLVLAGAVLAVRRIKDGTGIPMLAVLGTVAVWYLGDAYYNDYAHYYTMLFRSEVLQSAWLQVCLFLIVFLLAVPPVNRWYNARHLQYQSGAWQLAKFGIKQPGLQRQLDILFRGAVIIYAVIVIIAAVRLRDEIKYFFFPFLGYKAEPWGRARIGSGFDALLSFALYIQMMVTTIFGVLAAVSTNWTTRISSIALCFLSWPYFLFDRTRNTILAVIIPAVLSWVFLRLRGGIWKKFLVLAGCYIVVNGWMAFIIQNRSEQSIATAFRNQGFNLKQESSVHHEGLNMFEELCWINTFIEKGTYDPNWGARYFAELVNPIPRALWHGKPLIGIDYAIARGQGQRSSGGGGGADQGNVYATVSTGLIGQGVVNFGQILGPMAAAFLMSLWVALLARQDLHIMKLGRLPLYALGLILTFNLGRDITFITLYPFVFLAAALWWLDKNYPQMTQSGVPSAAPSNSQPPPQTGRSSRRRVTFTQPIEPSESPAQLPAPAPRRKMVTRFRPSGPRA